MKEDIQEGRYTRRKIYKKIDNKEDRQDCGMGRGVQITHLMRPRSKLLGNVTETVILQLVTV